MLPDSVCPGSKGAGGPHGGMASWLYLNRTVFTAQRFLSFFFFFQHVDKLLLSVIVDGGEVMILLSSGGYVDKLREYRPKIHSREPGLPVPLFNSFSYFYC